MSVFLIPVKQSNNYDIIVPRNTYDIIFRKIKIEHDIIDKPVKLDILYEIPPQVIEIPQHFIYEIKTKGYDVFGVNLFLPKLMRFLPKKGTNRSLLYYYTS